MPFEAVKRLKLANERSWQLGRPWQLADVRDAFVQ